MQNPPNNDKLISRHLSSYWNGIKKHTISVDGVNTSYLSTEKVRNQSSIIFIHGFASSKTYWRSIMMALKDNFHVIAVEVPGFNLTQWLPGKNHSLRQLSKWLKNFVDINSIDEFHLVGFSAGACLAAYFASVNPTYVKSLTFISFPNLYLEKESLYNNVFDECLYSDINCYKDLSALWDSLFYNPPQIPKMFHRIWFKVYENRKPPLLRILKELSDSASILYPRLSKLSCPVLAIRGEFDENSNTEMNLYLTRAISNISTAEVKKSSHLCYLERQQETLSHIISFIERNPNEYDLPFSA